MDGGRRVTRRSLGHAHGRNNCLGIEDVTASFADGLAASAAPDNPLAAAGARTVLDFGGGPVAINYIQGVVRTPPDFDTVDKVEFVPGRMTFVAASGSRVTADVAWSFIGNGRLPE